MMKIKDKDKILKQQKEKQQTQKSPWGYQLILQQKIFRPEESGNKHLKGWKGKAYNHDYSPSKDLIQIQWRNQNFTNKQKLGEFNITKPALQQILKEFI